MLLMEEDAEVGSMLVHEGEQLFITAAQLGGMFARPVGDRHADVAQRAC